MRVLLVRQYLKYGKAHHTRSMRSNHNKQVRGEDSKKTYKIYIGDRQLCSCGASVHHHDTRMMLSPVYTKQIHQTLQWSAAVRQHAVLPVPHTTMRATMTFEVCVHAMVCVTGGGKDWKDPQLCIHLLYVMIKVRSDFYSRRIAVSAKSLALTGQKAPVT